MTGPLPHPPNVHRSALPSLLPTKFFAPRRRPNAVLRPRLVQQIQAGLWRPLTVVCAPAGFGKTTLVAQWLAEADRPVAWLSLEPEDDEPLRFLSYVLGAVRRVRPELVVELEGAVPPAGQVALEPLLADLLVVPLAEEPDPFVLVLDDFHVIRDAGLLRALDWLVDNLPRCLHVLVTTRVEPEISLATRRARDQVTEIGAAELAFSSDETGEMVNAHCHLHLDGTAVAALQERTEGWPAGVHLVSLAVGRGGPLEEVLEALGDSGDAARFLVREVVDGLDPRLRSFLMRSAFLDRITAPLAAAVAGDEGAAEHLNLAYRLGLFLTPLDHRRRWFRFHHLFASTLRALLREEEPGCDAELAGRAARWWLEQGDPRTAAAYAMRAGTGELLAGIVDAHGLDLLLASDRLTLERWLSAVPVEADAVHPVVAVCRGWLAVLPLRSTPRVERALAAVAAGRAALARGGAPEARAAELADHLLAIESIATRPAGDLAGCAAHARATLERLAHGTPVARSVIGLQLGVLLVMLGRMEDALEPLARAAADGRAGRNDYAAAAAVGYRAWALRVLGRLDEAQALCERAVRLHEAEGTSMLGMVSHLHVELAHLHFARGALPEALAELEKAIPRARLLNDPFLLVASLALLTRVRQAAGEIELAADALRELEAIAAVAGDPMLEAWAAAARGDTRISPVATSAVIAPPAERAAPPVDPAHEPISPREREVLGLVVQGLSNIEIARALYVSPGTVKTHIHRILQKLGAKNRLQAVQKAQAAGIGI